ncbi:MAG: hypothetical protein QOI55_2948 [Actinomycetota bacterium]|nr:hypothetical protein [Actinomycetota bacterium]
MGAGTDDDTRRKFNRTENVRPIPADDPDFAPLYRRRNDAESINRGLDDSLWLGRSHSVGHERQRLNLIGFALTINSLARARHRRLDGLIARVDAVARDERAMNALPGGSEDSRKGP